MLARRLSFKFPRPTAGVAAITGVFERKLGGWLDRANARWYPDTDLEEAAGVEVPDEYPCNHCSFVAKNAAGLSSHMRNEHHVRKTA